VVRRRGCWKDLRRRCEIPRSEEKNGWVKDPRSEEKAGVPRRLAPPLMHAWGRFTTSTCP